MFGEYIDISDVKMPVGLPKFNFYKTKDNYDVAIALFETCNLNCKFCFEKHNAPIDIDRIMNMPENIISGIKNDINTYRPDYLVFRIWGGELFFDRIGDEMFDVYKDFYFKLDELARKEFPWIKTRVAWLTNGIWTKTDRIINLVKDTDGVLNFSYDPVQRFNSEDQKKIWRKNFETFNGLGLSSTVAITLTKQNIDAYIAGDEIFDSLPDTVFIDANYYVPNKNWREYIPSDEDLFRFFKWCIDNSRFNVSTVKSIMKHMIPEEAPFVNKCCDCKNTRQCQCEGTPRIDCAANVSTMERKMFYGKYVDFVNEDNCTEIKNSMGMIKRGCLVCEHYKTCTQMCWVSIIFEGYKITECPLKQIYRVITGEDIARYKEWRAKYDIH